MEFYYAFCFFVFGTVFGSFYNVVGYRLPKGQSIVYPSSYCPNCNHKLGPLELIPIVSFLVQRGKCKSCKQKISWFYPIFEFSCGILFMLAYLLLGFSSELVIAITLISMVLIIIISDYKYLIIPDEVLIVFTCLFCIEIVVISGIKALGIAILNGVIAFVFMYLLKKAGDFIFKKESMGGGDIKLMFIFGLIFGFEMAIVSVFIASIIGLPLSLIVLSKKEDTVIPFGPYLGIAAIIIVLSQIDFNFVISILTHRM